MAIKVCSKCRENNLESSMICVSCGSSLSNAKIVGVADSEKFAKPIPERCPQCDKKITGKPVMCTHCGYNLVTKDEDRYDYSTLDNIPSRHKNTGIYILSFIIPLVGIIIGAIWLASDDKQDIGKVAITYAIIGIFVGSILTLFIL